MTDHFMSSPKRFLSICTIFTAFFIGCGDKESNHSTERTRTPEPSNQEQPKTPEPSDQEQPKSKTNENEPNTIEIINEMNLTFDGEKPILETHLNQDSMISYIGIKLPPESKYAQMIKNDGFAEFSKTMFAEGRSRDSDVIKPSIKDHRGFGGFLKSYGLISTTSSLSVAATFSKERNPYKFKEAKKQAGLIMVVHNPEKAAINLNYLYEDYQDASGSFWEEEKEFARVKKIPGKDILGIYMINELGFVDEYQENSKPRTKWNAHSLIHVQAIWNEAKIELDD